MDYRLVITYDISDDDLRNELHKFLSNYGVNSQKSVFEMLLNEADFRVVLKFLEERVPQAPNDSVRIYELCKICQRHMSRVGEGIDLNPFDFEII